MTPIEPSAADCYPLTRRVQGAASRGGLGDLTRLGAAPPAPFALKGAARAASRLRGRRSSVSPLLHTLSRRPSTVAGERRRQRQLASIVGDAGGVGHGGHSGYTSRVSPTSSCPADNLPPPGQGTGSGLTGRVSPTPGALGADANPNPKPTPIPTPGRP